MRMFISFFDFCGFWFLPFCGIGMCGVCWHLESDDSLKSVCYVKKKIAFLLTMVNLTKLSPKRAAIFSQKVLWSWFFAMEYNAFVLKLLMGNNMVPLLRQLSHSLWVVENRCMVFQCSTNSNACILIQSDSGTTSMTNTWQFVSNLVFHSSQSSINKQFWLFTSDDCLVSILILCVLLIFSVVLDDLRSGSDLSSLSRSER